MNSVTQHELAHHSMSAIPIANTCILGTTDKILSQNPDGSRDLFYEKFATGVGMPKKDVADYVETQGFSVPKRFQTFQEAVDSGETFIIRSESPAEYAGMSGIYQSYIAKVREDTRTVYFSFPSAFRDIQELQARQIAHPTQQSYSLDYGYLNGVEFEGDSLKDEFHNSIILDRLRKVISNRITKGQLEQKYPLKITIVDEEENRTSDEECDENKNRVIYDGELPVGWNLEDIFKLLYNIDIRYLYFECFQNGFPKKIFLDGGPILTSDIPHKQVIALLQEEQKRTLEEENDEVINYSFWEYIPGINLAVCRDNVHSDVYYIYRQGDSWKTRVLGGRWSPDSYGCIRIEKGSRKFHHYQKYISLYEEIAHLPVFEGANSPIIEMQESKKGEIYYLQSLPTQSQQPLWNLERPLELGEFEAGFVRGSTPPEGLEIKLLRADDIFYHMKDGIDGFSLTTGDIRELSRDKKFGKKVEKLCQNSALGIIVYDRDGGGLSARPCYGSEIIDWVIGDHGGRSIMHKPMLTVLLDESLYTSLGVEYMGDPVSIRVISDGKRCFIRKLS